MKPALLLVLLCAAAHAEPLRVLISIGNDVGDPGDTPLQYAEQDAERVATLFTDLGGVAPSRATLIIGQGRDGVLLKVGEALGRVRELTQQGHEVTLLAYVSSHARAGVLRWRGTSFPIAELRTLLESSGARFTVLVVDACDSGVVAQEKGGRVVPGVAVAATPSSVRGAVYLSSSGPAEPSQEQAALRGSLFTHHWLTGLRGDADADADGRVSLAEAYAYTYRRTVAGAALGGQHPTFDIDATGVGDVVLTRPVEARSTVVLPADLEGDFLLVRQPRPDVVAEVKKERGRAVSLAVTPGRYALRKRMGLRVGVGEINLAYGGQHVVDERALSVVHFAEVATKDGVSELHPFALLGWVGLESEQLTGLGPRVQGGLALRGVLGAFWARIGLGVTGGQLVGPRLTTSELTGLVRGAAGWRFLEWPVVPFVGLLVDVRVVHQTYQRADAETIERVFGAAAVPSRTSVGFGAGPVAGLELPLGSRLVLVGEVFALVRALRAEAQPLVTGGLGGSLLLGVRL